MQRITAKRLDLGEAMKRVRTADRCRIKTAVSLITGFPEETTSDLRGSVSFIMDALRFDHTDPQLCLLAPLAKTRIETTHRENLVFDDIISDMSFQGWRQDRADRALIERYRDVFPNFYSVPTPHLDRAYLKELRDFMVNGVGILRWLLIGLHQDSGDLLTVFDAWRAWRGQRSGATSTDQSGRYYAGPEFRRDFLAFVRGAYIPSRPKTAVALSALVDYEAAFEGSTEPGEVEGGEHVADDGLIGVAARPRVAPGIFATTLGASYARITARLRRKQRLTDLPEECVTVVTRQSSEQRTEVIQLSPLSAQVLALCDGERTVGEVGAALSRDVDQIGGVPSEKACIIGLELLRRQGVVVLDRRPVTAPKAALTVEPQV